MFNGPRDDKAEIPVEREEGVVDERLLRDVRVCLHRLAVGTTNGYRLARIAAGVHPFDPVERFEIPLRKVEQHAPGFRRAIRCDQRALPGAILAPFVEADDESGRCHDASRVGCRHPIRMSQATLQHVGSVREVEHLGPRGYARISRKGAAENRRPCVAGLFFGPSLILFSQDGARAATLRRCHLATAQ